MNLLLLVYLLLQVYLQGIESQSYQVTPTQIASGGNVRLTINGTKGFSLNQFNFGDGNENLGNVVKLLSTSKSHVTECAVSKDGSHEEQILCDTNILYPYTQYEVVIYVDGSLKMRGNIISTNIEGPTITDVEPIQGETGSVIKMTGRVVSSLYTNTNSQGAAGETERILRSYLSGMSCSLLKPNSDELYGLHMNADKTGYVKCKMDKNRVGFYNASFLVNGPFGSAAPTKNSYKVNRFNDLYMVMLYPTIKTVTKNLPKSGSHIIEVNGNFDSTPAEIIVDNKPCTYIPTENMDKIECFLDDTTAGTSKLNYQGNGGVTIESWISDSTIETFTFPSNSIKIEYGTDFKWNHTNTGSKMITRAKAFFQVYRTGKHEFYTSLNSKIKFGTNNTEYTKKHTLDLKEGDEIYIEVISSEFTDFLSVNIMNTSFTEEQTVSVASDFQSIILESKTDPEIQTITFQVPSPVTHTKGTSETQKITITKTSSIGSYSLCIFYACTEWIQLTDGLDRISTKIKQHVFLGDTTQVTGSEIEYTIQFPAILGNVPVLSHVLSEGTIGVSLKVETVTEGQTGSEQFHLELMGGLSKVPVNMNDRNNSLTNSLQSLFYPSCPDIIQKSTSSQAFFDFETADSNLEYPVFCGTASGKHPTLTFNILIDSYPYLCLAYRLTWRMTLQIRNMATPYTIHIQMNNNVNWNYECFNILSEVKKTVNQQFITLETIRFYGYVDNVQVTNQLLIDAGSNILRMRTNLPWEIKEHSVKMGENDATITIIPYPGYHGFKLITVAGMNNPATFSNSLNVNTKQIQRASVPITGTYDIIYGSNVIKNIAWNTSLTKDSFKTLSNMGSVKVWQNTNKLICNTYITFLSGGPKEDIKISTKLEGDINRNMTYTYRKSMLKYSPISVDLIRSVHSTAQISLVQNNVSGICMAGNCDVTYNETGLPQTTKFKLTADMSLLFHEQKLTESDFLNQIISIKSSSQSKYCVFRKSSTYEIICKLEGIQIGTKYNVFLQNNVIGKQLFSITYTTSTTITIDDVDPKLLAHLKITVGTDICTLSNNVYTCTMTSVQPNSITQVSIVYESTNSLTAGQPQITNPNPTLKVQGGTHDITGSNFGTVQSDVTVVLGSVILKPLSVTDTNIQIKYPPQTPGQNDLHLIIKNKGIGSTKATSTLQVTGINQDFSSFEGGLQLKLTTNGLDTTDFVIKVGDNKCSTTNLTGNEATCTIPAYTQNLKISLAEAKINDIVWEKEIVEVFVGDSITLYWDSLLSVRVFETESTLNLTESTEKPRMTGAVTKGTFYRYIDKEEDFTLGAYVSGVIGYIGVHVKTRSSRMEPVTLEVSGIKAENKNGGQSINLGVCIQSDCPTESWPITNADPSKFILLYHPCITYQITNISTNPVNYIANKKDKIELSLNKPIPQTCAVSINILDATTTNQISGTCTSKSGDYKVFLCEPHTDSFSNLSPFTMYKMFMSTQTGGNAIVAIKHMPNMNIIPIPYIDSIQPTSGSPEGGTTLTIAGRNFNFKSNEATVTLGTSPCKITKVSANEIVCITNPGSTGPTTVNITSTNQNAKPIKCLDPTSDTCRTFTYTTTGISSVSSCSSVTYTGATFDITLNGQNFQSDTSSYKLSFVKATQSSCTIKTATANQITAQCDVQLLIGDDQFVLLHKYQGQISTTCGIQHATREPQLSPNTGSIHGGTTLTISGSGFDKESSKVMLGSAVCSVTSATSQQIVCITPANTAGATPLIVQTNNNLQQPIKYTQATYTYATTHTPTISGLQPASTSVSEGQVLSMTSSIDLGANVAQNVKVYLVETGCSLKTGTLNECKMKVNCTVQASSTGTSVKCLMTETVPGDYQVVLEHATYGFSNSLNLKVDFTVTDFNPKQGGTGGGQTITIQGTNFPNKTTTSVNLLCGAQVLECSKVLFKSSTSISCETAPLPATLTAPVTCTINVTVAPTISKETVPNSYSYVSTLDGTVASVSPKRGTTAGGTKITITGTNFKASGNKVYIDDSACVIVSESTTSVVCTTTAHKKSGKFLIRLLIGGNDGLAKVEANGIFQYAEYWSSSTTWNNGPLPSEGDLVVVPEHMTLIMDMEVTPVVKMILINGGRLEFDESKSNLELRAEYILINQGGSLAIGSEDKPFPGNAKISMYGNFHTKELPIYGAKCVAVRNGTLDLHGKPRIVTWTRLSETAEVGATIIKLKQPVDWFVGDEIVIATTGLRHSQMETEENEIGAISADNKILTLKNPIKYRKLGGIKIDVDASVSSTEVLLGAEVGLLSRNVIVQGVRDKRMDTSIPACDKEFHTGQFKTQSCFQGRFGEESGVDEFGAHIIGHAANKNSAEVLIRITYIKVYYAGQAFRLGRYPIHFHLLGYIKTKSYVKGVVVHKTFNRMLVIHGTHGVTVSYCVGYDIKGGALFLEDGIETGNEVSYNLVLKVMQSTSLLNDDITPAAIWNTNPNNTIQHNAAAGGTHFGIWMKMLEHPEGPSYDVNICPIRAPMGILFNNSAHSFGWFGIWIFPDYFPTVDGKCGGTTYQTAEIKNFVSWNNEKGLELVRVGQVQLKNMVLVNNEKAGVEWKLITHSNMYSDKDGPTIQDSYISGYDSRISPVPECTSSGIVVPWSSGLRLINNWIENFQGPSCSGMKGTDITGTCSHLCGGFIVQSRGLHVRNVTKTINFRWYADWILHDTDGTSGSNTANSFIVPYSSLLNAWSNLCKNDTSNVFSADYPGSICGSAVFQRVAFTTSQASMAERTIRISSDNGVAHQDIPFASKRLTLKPGNMGVLLVNKTYQLEWLGSSIQSNISYTIALTDHQPTNWVILCHRMETKPDKINGMNLTEEEQLNVEKHGHLSAAFNNQSKSICILFKEGGTVLISVYKCYYPNCITPVGEVAKPVEPTSVVWWSTPAPPNNKCEIDASIRVKANFTYSDTCATLTVRGILEFVPRTEGNKTTVLVIKNLIVIGGRVIAGESDLKPFTGILEIHLDGVETDPIVSGMMTVPIGTKSFAIFGDVKLYGQATSTVWCRLETKAAAGSNKIELNENVDWKNGDEVVISSSHFDYGKSEKVTVEKIENGRVVILKETLKYDHHAFSVTDRSGQLLKVGSEVGLLTRNIRIRSHNIKYASDEGFGGRIVVSNLFENNIKYIGSLQMQYVQLSSMGQYSFIDDFDPRFPISFMSLGATASNNFVRGISCHDSYTPCLGVFGSNNMTFDNNLVFNTVGEGIKITGTEQTITNNLIMNNVWEGGYYPPAKGSNKASNKIIWSAGLDISKLIGSNKVANNTIGGSERAGLHYPIIPCGFDGLVIESNVVHSTLLGIMMNNKTTGPETECIQIKGVTVWRAFDFGIYYHYSASVEISNMNLLENGVGAVILVYSPSILNHVNSHKYGLIKQSYVCGQTGQLNCDDKPRDSVLNAASTSRSFRTNNGGFVGFPTALFQSAHNNAGEKPFNNLMSYGALGGLTRIEDVKFDHFNQACTGKTDVAISSNPAGDDVIQPALVNRLSFTNTPIDNRVFLFRPNLGKINPSDCVDMDCDGLKQVLITDQDGTITGTPKTSIFSQAEFEWGGDPRRGLGNYRIPKSQLLDPITKNIIEIDKEYPNKGIPRANKNCEYISNWQAYKCPNSEYEMFVIESMDQDTETRRLSPISVSTKLSNNENFLNLLNGPQDHGWCLGYTCMKRVSTFHAIAPINIELAIFYTSSAPQKTKFYFLNKPQSTTKLLFKVHYTFTARFDVYLDNKYVKPLNGKYENDKLVLQTGDHIPNLTTGKAGDNWLDEARSMVYFLISGQSAVEIKTMPLIVLGFNMPAMTVDEFFSKNVVANLAAFLNIPANKIRVVKVTPLGNRRKRAASSSTGIKAQLEIHPDVPTENSAPKSTTEQESDRKKLENVHEAVLVSVQTGQLASTLQTPISNVEVSKPLPSPTSAEWSQLTNSSSNSTTSTTNSYATPVSYHAKVIGNQVEGQSIEIHIEAQDSNGKHISSMGSQTLEFSAILKITNPLSTTTVYSTTSVFSKTDGWAYFRNINLNYIASIYNAQIQVSYKLNTDGSTNNQATITLELNVAKRDLAISLSTDVPSNQIMTVSKDMGVMATVMDKNTNREAENINWNSHEWEVELTTCDGKYDKTSWTLSQVIGITNGIANVNRTIQFKEVGGYKLCGKVSLKKPSDRIKYYAIPSNSTEIINVREAGYVTPGKTHQSVMKIVFSNSNFNDIKEKSDGFSVALFNYLHFIIANSYKTVSSYKYTVKSGSIESEFTIHSDHKNQLDAFVEVVKQAIQQGTFQLEFDGQKHKADKLIVDQKDLDMTNNTVLYIILGVCLSILVIVIIIVVLVIKLRPKKTDPMVDDDMSAYRVDSRQKIISP